MDKKQIGQAVVWGCKPLRPIINIPPDALRVKIRLRPGSVGRAFVKFPDRIEEWYLQPADRLTLNHPQWILGLLRAVNTSK